MAKHLMFLDTETTGNEEKDFITQIAYTLGGERVNEMFKPPIPVSIESMAVTHITNNMLVDKPPFKGSPLQQDLKKKLESSDYVMVAHNAKFDAFMLGKEDIEVKQMIDTLKIARYLDPQNKIPKYNLQYLRYLLELDEHIDEPIQAHDAMGDVIVLEQLFVRQLTKIMEMEHISRDTAIDAMIDISHRPMEIKYFNFGKHKSKSVEEVAKTDRGYLEWLYQQKQEEGIKDEDWMFTLEKYLK